VFLIPSDTEAVKLEIDSSSIDNLEVIEKHS
jgi:hypothetical protein